MKFTVHAKPVPEEEVAKLAKWSVEGNRTLITKASLDQHQLTILARDPSGNLRGHVAVTRIYPQSCKVEIAGLVIDPECREKYVGKRLVRRAVSEANARFPALTPIAFVDETSEQVFAEAGFEELEPAQIPKRALALCMECPLYQDTIAQCCSKVMQLSPVQ